MTAYRRVTFADRCLISAYLKIKLSVTEIAKKMNFHKSTISREIKRNSESDYDPKRADVTYLERFKRCRKKFKIIGEIERLVIEKIGQEWSPDELCGRLRREQNIILSHTTIYKYIAKNHSKESPVRKALRKFKKKGSRRICRRKNRPEWMKTIHDRPTVINERSRLGDWERDTMFGKDRKRLIVCLDRKSRYTKLAKVKEPYCLHLTEQTIEMLQRTGKFESVTNDNGSEFQDGYMFDMYDIPVFYCDARSPQQRGSVENQIGLIRQYITKKTDLDTFDERRIQEIEDKLNNRPRKCLDYQTPNEVFFQKTVALVS